VVDPDVVRTFGQIALARVEAGRHNRFEDRVLWYFSSRTLQM
jgi:hypothetical protein